MEKARELKLIEILLSVAILAGTSLTGFVFKLQGEIATLKEEARISQERDTDQYKEINALKDKILDEVIEDRDFYKGQFYESLKKD